MNSVLVTILLSVLGVVGTLIGALGSTLLANYQAMKLEKLKITQEKLKRDTEKVEEVYTLALQVDKWFLDAVSEISKASRTKDYTYNPYVIHYEEIKPSLDRIRTLTTLYLPQVSASAESFIDNLSLVRDPIYHSLYLIALGDEDKEAKEVDEEFDKASRKFARSYIDFLFSLEKLVK